MDSTDLRPLSSLLKEHRLIERMLVYIETILEQIESKNEVDPTLIDIIVDFFETYAGRHHEGKEENVLFKILDTKTLEVSHLTEMEKLVDEHKEAKNKVGNLLEAKQKYSTGDLEALSEIATILKDLTQFYPRHIKLEDNVFFPAAITYLEESEIVEIEKKYEEIDSNQLHKRYVNIIDSLAFGE